MTLAEAAVLDRDTLTCAEVAAILHIKQGLLHSAAICAPGGLGFPAIAVGNHVLFPRKPFLRYMGEIDA